MSLVSCPTFAFEDFWLRYFPVGGFKPLQVYATPAPMCPPQFQSPPQFHGQPYGGHGYEYGYPPQPANYRHEPPPHVHNPGNQSPASSTLSPFSPDAIPITRTHSPQPMSPLNEGASAASAALPRSIPTTSRSLPPAVNPTGSSGVALGRSNTMSSTHSHQAAMPSGGRKRDRMKGMFGMGGKV